MEVLLSHQYTTFMEAYDYYSIRLETQHTEIYSNPNEVRDAHFMHLDASTCDHDGIGRWMVFKLFDEIEETWEQVKRALLGNDLQGAVICSCSTLNYNPTLSGPGPQTVGVIGVRTEEHNMDDIGFKLIQIAKQDIKYKLIQATCDFKYAHMGSGRVSIKTIFWNNGSPSFDCESGECRRRSGDKEDIWKLNVVGAPEPLSSQCVHGWWELPLDYRELTGTWHFLKKRIETGAGADNFCVIKMVCPPKYVRNSATEIPVFHIYTSAQHKESVGITLINLIKRDIFYEHNPQSAGSHTGHKETLFWNDGEPHYEKIRRKGITKNWRTGEDM